MRWLLALLLVVAAGGGLWWWLSGEEAQEPRILDTAVVQKGTVREVLQATGIVKATVGAEVKIGAQATGLITRLPVQVGERVDKGQLVAVIDDRELQTRRREAVARLNRLEAELERIRQVYPLQIRETRAELEADRAQARYAQRFLERQQKLFEQNLIAEDTLEDAREKAEVAGNELDARQATLERLEAEFDKELHKTLKDMEEARAVLESMDVRISYTRIHSPISGVVSNVTAQEGETVVAGLQVANLVTVLDPTRLEMWIYVDETDVGRVTPGLPVEFRVDAYPDRAFSGTIEQIYPQPEIRDNIVYYRALVPLERDVAQWLRPEMTTQCRIIVQTKEDVLSIPNTALKWVEGKQYVYVQDNGQVRRTTPELGLTGQQRSEVLSGLEAGQRVATQVIVPQMGKGGS
jgi:HlyD family secretion protein/macrolide-specific efflux system membrane fusion protein